MGTYDLKDLFQFGVPTGLLIMLLWQVAPFMKAWLTDLLSTFREGFDKMETAAKENNSLWRTELGLIHKEDREDREADRKLRHDTNEVMNAMTLQMRDQLDEIRAQKSSENSTHE